MSSFSLLSSTALTGLARALVVAGKLPALAAKDIAHQAETAGASFIAQLMASGLMSAAELAQHIGEIFGMPVQDLDAIDIQQLPSHPLDTKLCINLRVLPLAQRGHRLVVATADPTDIEAVEQVKFSSQMALDWVVVEYDKLQRLIERLAQATTAANTFAMFDRVVEATAESGHQMASEQRAGAMAAEVEDAPVVRFVQQMLLDACQMQASDLHFEPYEHEYRVRFRIDGQLREIAAPPIVLRERLASRIKIMSRLDIAEKRVPQDGRMKLDMGAGRMVDFRVSTLPTLFGEKVVIRILDARSGQIGIDALGYEAQDKQRLLEAICRPYGMILATGPTGSGKTVSLYSCLNLLNQSGVNISTVEDPSEIYMPGINQVNVNEKAGLTFATALRAFLRQDPDVIMVGEIRDLETADIAVKAAQTGHLVLSTLHTNDAPATLMRLRNMGIAPFNIASSVILVMAQRLVRCLCPRCKKAVDIPHAALLDAGFDAALLDGSWQPYQAVGCPACNQGYKGRVGLYQVMPISMDIQTIILRGGSVQDISAQARREGVQSLRESGLMKVRQGLTSLQEVQAVTRK